MENSRTKNTVLNSVFGIIGYVAVIIVSFILRKMLASILGSEYLGLNSLYTNIVSFLSLTELGLSTAIVYFLYKPISDGDENKVKAYLEFYKKAYRIIALIVFIVGCALIFALPFIAKTTVEIRSVQIYFLLYVVNTSVSYLIAYKKCIIYADQKARVISLCHAATKIVFSALQIAALYLMKSFLWFTVIMIVCTVADNAACAIYANKKYPYIKNTSGAGLTKDELNAVKLKIIPIALQSLAGYVVTSTDSIIISAVISVGVVGIYSNYTLISTTLKSLYGQVFSAFTNSFGNLSVSGDVERSYYIYDKSVYAAFCMTCCMTTCFVSVVNPFIGLCFGTDYVLNYSTIFLVAASFYFMCMNTPAISAQNALGLHGKDVAVVLMQGALNLVLSLVLVYVIGLNGVIIGTIASTVLCPFFSKDYVIHKYFFKKNPIKIYACQLAYLIVTAASCAIGYYVSEVLLTVQSWLALIGDGILVLSISAFIVIATTFWTDKFKFVLSLAKKLIRRKR